MSTASAPVAACNAAFSAGVETTRSTVTNFRHSTLGANDARFIRSHSVGSSRRSECRSSVGITVSPARAVLTRPPAKPKPTAHFRGAYRRIASRAPSLAAAAPIPVATSIHCARSFSTGQDKWRPSCFHCGRFLFLFQDLNTRSPSSFVAVKSSRFPVPTGPTIVRRAHSLEALR